VREVTCINKKKKGEGPELRAGQWETAVPKLGEERICRLFRDKLEKENSGEKS
jgi:hypothetical protein